MAVTIVGDATSLPFPDEAFDAIITSPTYGNRMADHHDARDNSRRLTYRHSGTHPATWSAKVIDAIATAAWGRLSVSALVLDPFAGVGAPELEQHLTLPMCRVVGVELDRDWAAGGTRRINDPLHERNTGRMQWGSLYQVMHGVAWREAERVLKPGGWFFLNVSDHVRANKRIEVVKFHVQTLVGMGFERHRVIPIATPRMRFGANGDSRVPCEYLVLLRKPEKVGG